MLVPAPSLLPPLRPSPPLAQVEALTSVASLLHQTADASSEGVRDQSSEFGHDLERLVPKLAECIEDSHHKVCVCGGGGA